MKSLVQNFKKKSNTSYTTIQTKYKLITKFLTLGIAERIAKEVAMFGVKSITFDVGMHRTQVFGNVYMESPHIPEYAELDKALLGQLKMVHGNEPGDPKKAVERMVDVVGEEGASEGKTLPLRLPIGRDSLKIVRDKCKATLDTYKEREEMIASTDVVPAQ